VHDSGHVPHLPLSQLVQLWGGKTSRRYIGDAENTFELLWLLLTTVLAWARPQQDLVLDNLLLRHQLAVLTRPFAPDRVLGSAAGTSCCRFSLAAGVLAGVSI
jgi:hypothetical protein